MTGADLRDPYRIDDLYAPEERMIRDAVRDYARSELEPHVGAWWEEGRFPEHLPRAFGELGLLGMTLPEQAGGAGASATAYGLACRELEYADSGLRSFMSVQNGLVAWPLHTYGSESLQARWLPTLISGEAIGCFGLTEPDAGSDPGSMRASCRRVGREWVLTGTKRWITSGSSAHLAIVWARDEESQRVLGFAVDTSDEGFRTVDVHHKASMRASVTSELHLEEVRVPESDRLDVVGLRGALSCLTKARFGIAFGALGAGAACFEEAAAYVSDRPAFGEPLAAKQLVQASLADMWSDLTKGSLLAHRLGRLEEAGEAGPMHVSMAKRDNVRTALAAARASRDLLGANGITTEYASIRHLLNLETVSTYEGTDAIHTLALGAHLTGHKAF